jgi:hypothetical protein
MRGQRATWAQIGNLRVVDGDGIEWQNRKYRLEGYDAPEVHVFRSKRSRGLEWTRGMKAMNRLVVLIRGARSVYLLPSDSTDRHGRVAAILLVDGKDVAQIAMHERWGCPGNQRQRVDWGRPETPFADHLPMPEGVEEYEEDDNLS